MKLLFTVIHVLLITAGAYLCVDIMYKQLIPEIWTVPAYEPSGKTTDQAGPKVTGPKMDKDQFLPVINRNIFNVEVEEPAVEVEEQKAEPEVDVDQLEHTQLKISLWGTVTGSDPVYAVIEDKKERKQSLYGIGDTIQEAQIKKILRRSVVLNYNGRDQILEMTEKEGKGGPERRPTASKKSTRRPPRPELPNKPPGVEELPGDDQLSSLMKQVKIRPHFSQGEPDGLMVYGIRPQSVFRQIGMRNGDIITDINGTQITTAEDALQMYEQIQDADSATISVLRRGKEKEIAFEKQEDGQYVAVPVEKAEKAEEAEEPEGNEGTEALEDPGEEQP